MKLTLEQKTELRNHKERMSKYYGNKPEYVEFILKFFEVKEGVRCRSRLDPIPKSNGKQHYTRYNESMYDWSYGKDESDRKDKSKDKYSHPLVSINKENIESELVKGKTLFFYNCIFSEDITNCNSSEEVIDCIIGFTPVMDTDSPYLYPEEKHSDGRKKRIDTRSMDGIPVMEQFNEIRLIAKEELKEFGLWKDARMMHSGNGMYIILPDFYGTIDEIDDYAFSVDALIDDINIDIGSSLIDNIPTPISWATFFKIPYTFHADYNRISIPVRKDAKFAYKPYIKDW